MILIDYGINNRKSQVSSNFLKTSKRSFKKGLSKNYIEVDVSIVECPDLRNGIALLKV